MFPLYIINNERLLFEIEQSQALINLSQDHSVDSIFYSERVYEDFNFKEDDTFAIVSLMKYE